MSDFTPGKLIKIAPGVRRITAPNAGVMTGPGTNSYLLGEATLSLIDPGPAIDAHIQAILSAVAASDAQLKTVFCTHTHPDHSPAAKEICAHTGAQLVGAEIEDDGHQDKDFKPDITPTHNHVFEIDSSTLTAIYTPGHVGNHFCWLDKRSGLLFTGDHIMQGSTVVIIPPAGDMKDYIESLVLLKDYPIEGLAPGHGEVIRNPMAEIDRLVQHRMSRENKIVETLRSHSGTLEELTPIAYDDVDKSLLPIATFSLWAVLLKLQKEDRAKEVGKRWELSE